MQTTVAAAAELPEAGGGRAVGGLPEEERPRERLSRLGADRLAPAELLAVVLGTGTRGRSAVEVAQRLLEDSGGLRRLSTRTLRETAASHGVGAARGARVVAAFELGRQVSVLRNTPGPRFRSGSDIFRHYHGRLRDLRKEQFWEQLPFPL